jgi:glutamate N-acetyltransferase/amino-acid N-acetyltransferase
MVAVLANGASGARRLTAPSDPGYEEFAEVLERVCVELARMIVRDGEGATKFIEITVTGAASEEEAARGARAIANSNLVKTAIHGEDANWGRILAALGNAEITFDPARVEIRLGHVPILRHNFVIDFSEAEASAVLARPDIVITADLGQGSGQATFWTCDLSARYVEINANYRT